MTARRYGVLCNVLAWRSCPGGVLEVSWFLVSLGTMLALAVTVEGPAAQASATAAADQVIYRDTHAAVVDLKFRLSGPPW